MSYLPDTNACITLLRERNPRLIARWRKVKVSDVLLCSVVVYELRHGGERSALPSREHAKLDVFLAPFVSLPFDNACALTCARLRHELECGGMVIGPHDPRLPLLPCSMA